MKALCDLLNNNSVLTAQDLWNHKVKSEAVHLTAAGEIELDEDEHTGYFETDVFDMVAFNEVVGTFNGYTYPMSALNLAISMRIDHEMSAFFSYGDWGLGKLNVYYDQSDSHSHMCVDQILVDDGLMADGVKIKVTLLRADQALESPRLRQVSLATKPNITELSAEAIAQLPKKVAYDVPKFNQNRVPVIGGEMCSATTSAMLVAYMGLRLDDRTYPHRAMAHLVADAGHHAPTFGNWAYNIDAMGALGYNSSFIYSTLNGLKAILANVGPCGASIKGQTDYYHTNGHLICVTGYEEREHGTVLFVNDPNVDDRFGKGLDVAIEMSEETFMRVWRNAIYTIESSKK